jgi:hypothetical protein
MYLNIEIISLNLFNKFSNMGTETIRERLHGYIDFADDKKINAIYTMVEDEIVEERSTLESKRNAPLSKTEKIILMQDASRDLLFLADVKEISEDFGAVDKDDL